MTVVPEWLKRAFRWIRAEAELAIFEQKVPRRPSGKI